MNTSDYSSGSSPWTLAAEGARLDLRWLQLSVPHASPREGITQISWQSQPIEAFRLLQLQSPACSPTPPPLVDAYVRGADLVASYAQAERGAVQPQVYFRASQLNSAAGLELIVSMQTSLLDSAPESLVTSELPAREVLVLDSVHEQTPEPLALQSLPVRYLTTETKAAYLFLFRVSDTLSYAEMVHPGDFVAVELESTDATAVGGQRLKLTWRLFPERLEKGVIRRCRIAGWFLPREGDQQASAEIFRRMLLEPLPLTA